MFVPLVYLFIILFLLLVLYNFNVGKKYALCCCLQIGRKRNEEAGRGTQKRKAGRETCQVKLSDLLLSSLLLCLVATTHQLSAIVTVVDSSFVMKFSLFAYHSDIKIV